MSSFKSNENIHKKEDGSYYVTLFCLMYALCFSLFVSAIFSLFILSGKRKYTDNGVSIFLQISIYLHNT